MMLVEVYVIQDDPGFRVRCPIKVTSDLDDNSWKDCTRGEFGPLVNRGDRIPNLVIGVILNTTEILDFSG